MVATMKTTMNSSTTTTRIYLWTALSLSRTVLLHKKTKMRTMMRIAVTTMISTSCRTIEIIFIIRDSSERTLCSHRTHRSILPSLRSSRDRQLAWQAEGTTQWSSSHLSLEKAPSRAIVEVVKASHRPKSLSLTASAMKILSTSTWLPTRVEEDSNKMAL